LTTFVTRLIDTTVSLISSCDASIFSASVHCRHALKLQSRFTRRVGHRLHAPVIQESVAIKYHARHAFFLQPLGDRLADRLRARQVAALRLLRQRALDRRLDRSRPTAIVRPGMSSTTCTYMCATLRKTVSRGRVSRPARACEAGA
jgi:hypothetical protein